MKAVAAIVLVLCYLAPSQAWNCTEGPRLYHALQIDAGHGQVVGINRYSYVYFLLGTHWYRLSSLRVKHCSVGPAGLWAVSTTNNVFKWSAGRFHQHGGMGIQQVDAGGNGQVVGTGSNQTYCLTRTNASAYREVADMSWQSLSWTMQYYSCGPFGCWGVDSSHKVYFTQGINASTCATGGWIHLPGQSMNMIEVGTDGSVFGVGTDGRIYQRIGINSSWALGTEWSIIAGCMTIRHVSYDLGYLWAVTESGLVLLCTE
ncbi:fish-egg lectin-like [Chelmon rostratus]|uniref:fish-egg lectin-like n=1 Tax=Chelmon rostratus TaxID=109905 RepID=UPI001BEBD695|nr:fish-egg lectin-like [Chelmon rostratus]